MEIPTLALILDLPIVKGVLLVVPFICVIYVLIKINEK